ncbi:N/A [soil metagenome]
MKSLSIALALVSLGGAVAGCAHDTASNSDGKLTVVVAFYPIEELVRRVGGTEIQVNALVAPGNEPHEFEPTPRQVTRLESADVVFYLGSNFQPDLQQAIEGLPGRIHRIDLLDGLPLRTIGDTVDPHVWLDPRNMATMAMAVAAALAAELPEQATTFTDNAALYVAQLDRLHEEFASGLAECAVPVLITTHEAFGYLAAAYGLTQLAIAGISPGDEPSAKSLQALAELAAANGVTTVFFEENLPTDLAATVADEIGATTSSLDTVESLTQNQLDAGESYLSIMHDNLRALRAGMGCT